MVGDTPACLLSGGSDDPSPLPESPMIKLSWESSPLCLVAHSPVLNFDVICILYCVWPRASVQKGDCKNSINRKRYEPMWVPLCNIALSGDRLAQ